jgi:hypothetical protein
MLGMNILTPTVLGDRLFTSAYGGGSRLLEIRPSGDGFNVETVWNTSLQGYMSTPVVIDGHAYLHLRSLTVYLRFGVVSSVAASVCVFSRNRSRRFACGGLAALLACKVGQPC